MEKIWDGSKLQRLINQSPDKIFPLSLQQLNYPGTPARGNEEWLLLFSHSSRSTERGHQEDEARFLSVVSSIRTRGNEQKWIHRKYHLDMRKKNVGLIERDCGVYLTGNISQLYAIMCHLGCSGMILLEQGSWARWPILLWKARNNLMETESTLLKPGNHVKAKPQKVSSVLVSSQSIRYHGHCWELLNLINLAN